MLNSYVDYLDSNPIAVKARASYLKKTESFKRMREARKERSRQQAAAENRAAEEQIRSEPLKPKNEYIINAKNSEVPEKISYTPREDVQEKTDTLSPSVISILVGLLALIFLAFAKSLFDHKHGPGGSDWFFEPLIVAIFTGVPLFIALRYIFKNGISECPERLKNLIFGVFIIFFIGAIVSHIGGGRGEFCAYIVGCI